MAGLFDRLFGRKDPAAPPGPMRDVGTLARPVEREALHLVRKAGASRSMLGGDPALPPGIPWPKRDGRPLRFLARLSLAEVQGISPVAWLPSTGALLFFYDDEEQPWGFDPAHRGGSAVLWLEEPVEGPTVTAASIATLLPESPLELRPLRVLPSLERDECAALELSDEEGDAYIELAEERYGGLPRHQALGWPSPVQGDLMELECQLASHGVYCGKPSDYDSPRARELAAGAANWRLLLQLDSDDELEMNWGDAGRLYFWVEDSAARKADFSNAWTVLQCT